MQSPFSFDEMPVVMSMSIGICVQSAEYANGTKMLKQANQAMYLAKREGRNRYSFGYPALPRMQLGHGLGQKSS